MIAALKGVATAAALGLVAVLAACGRERSVDLCAPAEASSYLRAVADAPQGPVRIYWDGSESMAGYVDGATDSVRPLGDLEALLGSVQDGTTADWFRFGLRITPLRTASGLATPGFYRCGGGSRCDNQESRIDLALGAIAARDEPGLSVVVTDLWLSNSAFQGSAEVALGQPLRAILSSGRSIGVLGIRAPYEGPIYDVPGVGVHLGARERPLYVLLIGTRIEVLATYQRLVESGSPALNEGRIRFSLFTTEPTNAWLGAATPIEGTGRVSPARLIGGDFEASLPQVSLSLESLRRGEDTISVPISPQAAALPGAVWRGRMDGDVRVWRRVGNCDESPWAEEPALNDAWRARQGEDQTATMRLDGRSASELVADSTYLVEGRLWTAELEPDSPETAWMREWSVSPDRAAAVAQRAPSFFPTLNLAGFAEQLEAALGDAARSGGLTLAVVGIAVRVEP